MKKEISKDSTDAANNGELYSHFKRTIITAGKRKQENLRVTNIRVIVGVNETEDEAIKRKLKELNISEKDIREHPEKYTIRIFEEARLFPHRNIKKDIKGEL